MAILSKRISHRLATFAALALVLGAMQASAKQLVMVTEPGCAFCAAFVRDEAQHYARTPQGHKAPLRMVTADQAGKLGIARIWGTPTFVMIADDGKEIGRFLGFIGASAFYESVDDLLARHPP